MRFFDQFKKGESVLNLGYLALRFIKLLVQKKSDCQKDFLMVVNFIFILVSVMNFECYFLG
jgi:hypothetical protein